MTPKIHISQQSQTPSSFHIYYSFAHTPPNIRPLLLTKALEEDFAEKKDELIHLEQVSKDGIQHSVVVGLSKGDRERVMRSQTMKAVQLARTTKQKKITIVVGEYASYLQQIGEGALLGDYSLDQFKSKDSLKKHPHITDIFLIVADTAANQKAIAQAEAAAKATLLARNLVNSPGSHVFPETLSLHAREIETKSEGKVAIQVLSDKECEKLSMGSFLSVGKGSNKKSQFIILHYKGLGKKKIALVGKSITFDSGGLSLKPGEHMMDMKIDMAGGATVLGVFDYLATMSPRIDAFADVYGILPAAENVISGSATKPGDIVTAMNGKTIEILNTDAEGRLVLADGLVYAEKVLKADYIIDIATLTGACMVALGADLAGLFASDDAFEKQYSMHAHNAGDDYWRMPLHEGYAHLMKSSIADLKNIGGGRYGGAITAALFLKEFIQKAKWMHIDIAGPAHSEKGGASGWGVLSIIYFLINSTRL